MKPFVYTLENEKRIFMVIISTMLLSLIFMSVSYRFVKDKNEEFQQDLVSVSAELDLLMELLPEKDKEISQQEEKIRDLAQELKHAVENHNLTKVERDALAQKIAVLKKEMGKLKLEVKYYQEKELEKIATVILANNEANEYGDSMVAENYRNEIAFLKRTIYELTTRTPSVVVKNRLSAYYFQAVSSDKRSRASKTSFLLINLQMRGDVSLINGVLQLEVVDPQNNLVTEKNHKVRVTADNIIDIKFMPEDYKFIKGRYHIRLYSHEGDFETKTFIDLR